MSNFNRVFITGLSAVTACGLTAEATWNAILAGQSGIKPIQKWDVSSWTHQLGGEIPDIKPAAMLPDRKLAKAISQHDMLGIYAATQAVDHSQMVAYRETLSEVDAWNEMTGIFVGSPGNKYYQQYDFLPLLSKTGHDMPAFGQQLFAEVHPMWLLRILPNNVLAYTGITYGFKGANHNVTNHAVGGMQALIEAFHAIRSGQIERAVVVAYDIATEPQSLFYYDKLGVISAQHLKPFDKAHDGTILAEGASAIVLESEASARQRQAVAYGEVLGGYSSSEQESLYSIEEDGDALAGLLQQMCQRHQLQPQDIGFIVAHGNGNRKSDVSEAKAILKAFDAHAIPVTAFKWAVGHSVCASGVVDTVLATQALQAQCIPGIANLEQRSSDCQHLNVSQTTRAMSQPDLPVCIINRGFSSMNTCLLLKAHHGVLA